MDIRDLSESPFAATWKTLESQQPLPRRMRHLVITSFSQFTKKIEEHDPSFVQEIVHSLYSGDVYLLKRAFSPDFMTSLRGKLQVYGKTKPSEFYSMVEGVPNYHRIIDESVAKNYTFEAIKHSYYFFPFNNDPFGVFAEAYPRWRPIKLLSGLRADEYERNTPKDGMVDRIQIAHYPAGSGRIETHSDPYKVQRIIISCFMTKRGKDYKSGGVYFMDRENKKVDCEDYVDVGDMQIYFPTVLHGVAMIDEGTPVNWEILAGRWWFGPFSNSSNQAEKRHVGFGVKDQEIGGK